MNRGLVRFTLIAAPAILAGAIVYARQAPPAAVVIPQPDAWVPLSADSVIVDSEGQSRYERIYRSSDGSTRYDGYSSAAMTEVVAVAIKNIPQVRYFTWQKERGWTSQPMDIPPGGWVPRPRLAQSVIVTGETIEGFAIVRQENDQLTILMAPALNMFKLYEEIRNCSPGIIACTTRVFNIRVGEQPAHLFDLPDGAQPVTAEQPGGIIRRRPR